MSEAEISSELVFAGASALGTAIAVVWRRNERLNAKLLETVEKVGKLEGKNAGIVTLSAQVLETVRQATEAGKDQ